MDRLPSGAYRVRVYTGSDPVTGKRHDLTELVPPGPRAAAEAEKVRTRLLGQLDERRNPRTRATLNQLLDRYVEVLDVDESTRKRYVGYIDNRIRPTLGELQVGRLDGEVLDSFYAELRRCRDGCTGRRRGIDHRTQREHDCDERCRPHSRRSATRHKDTKTHQMRRIALDAETVEILREHVGRQDDRIRRLGLKPPPRDPFLFSLDPDCGTPLLPDSVSQRFDRLARRLNIGTTLHKLRHYNATELIGAGVDVRTVAGRLGHAGGGATTLRVYAAWVNEADRRAADTVASRLPRRPPREREFEPQRPPR